MLCGKLWAPVFIGAFFAFLFLFFGPGEYPDSITYINHYSGREPVYPLFLLLCKKVSGEGMMLTVACFFQNVFAAFSTYYLWKIISKSFGLRKFLQIIFLFILIVPNVLTAFFTQSGIILSNAILSEGLSYSLYLLFCALVISLIYDRRRRDIVLAFFVAFIISLTRSQLMPLILAMGVIAMAVCIRGEKHKIIRFVLILVTVIVSFLLRDIGIKSYNFVVNGKFEGLSGDGNAFLTNVLYSADLSKIDELELTKEDFAILTEISEEMIGRELNAMYSTDSLIDKILYHESCHDVIKFEVLDKYDISDETGMAISVLKGNIGRFIETYLFVVIGGFVRSVAILSLMFLIYTFVFFASYVGLIVGCYRKKRVLEAHLGMVMLLLLLANVSATSLTIMCLSRYMIYNTSMLYISFLIMALSLFFKRKENTINE